MMKQIRYQVSVDIDAPIDVATGLFVNREKMACWEEGLVAIADC